MKNTHFAILMAGLVFTGCNFLRGCKTQTDEIKTEVIAALDRGISELAVASADWQDVLNGVINDLPGEVQSTVTNEVTNLLNRGIAATGAEFRCNVDFLRNRMRQELQRIKAKFLGAEIPPLEPELCNVVPLAIDMALAPNRRNKIEFYGYDFDMSNIEVVHVVGNAESNVTGNLDQPTHYHMTLNLGAAGVPLNENSKRLILRWNNRNVSTIAVIQPSPDICETKFDNFRPGNITVIPKHATMPGKSRGDKEFDGNGPSMYCSVSLINRDTHIDARIYVTAGETKKDWTYGKEIHTSTIYTADPGFEIEHIVASTYAQMSYTDNDHSPDEFAGSGPVQKFIFNGDGSGSDIERNTKVTIQFNPLRVQLKETGDCTSSAAVRSIERSGMISPQLENRIGTLRSTMHLRSALELDSLVSP